MDRYDEEPAMIERGEQQRITAQKIARFLGCDGKHDAVSIVERDGNEWADLTEQCKTKAVTSKKSYWFYDQREEGE